MKFEVRTATHPRSFALLIATAIAALAIFILDTITSEEVAMGTAYAIVVLIAARFLEPKTVVAVAAGCATLLVLSLLLKHPAEFSPVGLSNLLISMSIIGLTTYLALLGQSMTSVLRNRAGLLDVAHDTIFARDMNDVITYWNRGAEQLYGWKREEAIGKITHTLLRTQFPQPLEEITATLLETGRWEGELVHTTRSGAQVFLTSRWSLQIDDHGRPIAILETNNDVTERKRAEDALQKSESELARVTRLTTLGQLAASIAHEIKQPLAAVATDAEAAKRWLALRPPDLEEAAQSLGRISGNAHRAAGFIDHVGGLVRKTEPKTESLDINDTIRDIVGLTNGEARRNGVLLQSQLASELPPLQVDRIQLQQVILNLIVNAIESTKDISERAREVIVGSQFDDSGYVVVWVRDSGGGLDGQNAERLFEAFYTTKATGMGMGLAICRSIIERHGGRIWASPNSGPGAIFRFSLPLPRATDR